MGTSQLIECKSDGMCPSGHCESFTCGAPSERGHGCSLMLQNCPTGLYCHPLSQTCQDVGHVVVTPCRNYADCPKEKFCEIGTCRPRLQETALCGGEWKCADGLICRSGVCRRRCMTSEFFPCSPDSSCQSNGVCMPHIEDLGHRFEFVILPVVVMGLVIIILFAHITMVIVQYWQRWHRRQRAIMMWEMQVRGEESRKFSYSTGVIAPSVILPFSLGEDCLCK